MRTERIYGPDGSLYLTRYILWNKGLRLFLHRIHRKDFDRDVHDHPWPWALSLILRGGYEELRVEPGEPTKEWEPYQVIPGRQNRWTFQVVRRLNWIGPNTYHRILAVQPNTWTLFIAGPRSREWGFLTDRGHVDWRAYLGLPEGKVLND